MSNKLSLLEQARKFREAFEFSDEFSLPSFFMQRRLISEEYEETIAACMQCVNDDFTQSSKIELLKELADLVFVCYQMAAYMDIDLDQAMYRVFKSNMSKLDDEGKPIRRHDGKVLKGPNYKLPILDDLIKN